jgi:uncharacterized phosphosugar-binding protein
MVETELETTGFGARMRVHLERVEAHNAAVLDAVADEMLAVVRADGLIHTTGAGHSGAMALEMFFRAGGLACVNPIVHPALSPLSGALTATALERVSGLGEVLVRQARPSAGDLAFVFSNSGINPVPVELAEHLRAAGVRVVAVTSVEHMASSEPRADAKLDAYADHVVDSLLPPGDAFYRQGPLATAPLSSLVSVYVWDLLLARLAGRATATAVDLPLWTSSNVPGGDDRNATLAERYRTRVPAL